MRRDYGHVYNYKATGTGGIGKYLIAKFGSNDGEVALCGAGESAIGVTTDIAAAEGERCDVVRSGLAPVIYGGTVTRGALLVSDAAGKAVAAAPAQGANVRVIGIAEVSGASGDVGAVFLTPGIMQGA